MDINLAAVVAVVGALIGLSGLVPWLRASDRRAEHAKSLATAQQQALYIDALSRERDDLKTKVAELERRVRALEERNDELHTTIEKAMRHE